MLQQMAGMCQMEGSGVFQRGSFVVQTDESRQAPGCQGGAGAASGAMTVELFPWSRPDLAGCILNSPGSPGSAQLVADMPKMESVLEGWQVKQVGQCLHAIL